MIQMNCGGVLYRSRDRDLHNFFKGALGDYMKAKPWEGKQWKEAEKSLFDLSQIDFDPNFVYGIDTALTLLKEALEKDYENED
jgi:hypothetical protein